MIQKKLALILGSFLGLAGCVSTKEYRRSLAETSACLTEKSGLAQQVETLTTEKANLAQSAEEKEAEISKLKGTYDELVGNLKNEISSGQIQVTELKGKLTLNMVEKILFNSGQASVKESGQKVLDRIASALKNIQDKDIRVEGYTDNTPLGPKLRERFPTNWELSTARATNVVRYLEETDQLDPSRLVAAGFGQYHPISENDTEEGRAQNRRIDIVLVPHEVSGSAAHAHAVAASEASTPASVDESTASVASPVEDSTGTASGEPAMVPAGDNPGAPQ
jgi:flagellar motor protein MotB